MHNTLKNNIRLLSRYFAIYIHNIKSAFFKKHFELESNQNKAKAQISMNDYNILKSKDSPMSFSKSLILFISKTAALLILINFFLISPLKQSLNAAAEGFNQNPLVKIIGLDFIRNPITFIRMANYYLDKGKLDQAELFLSYAEILITQYPYPKQLISELNTLKERVSLERKLAIK